MVTDAVDITTGLALTPQVGWLTVNRDCNMRCEWCYARGTEYSPADDMGLDLAMALLKSMSEVGVKKVILIGGEPTLWKHLFDVIDAAKELRLSTTLVTNGTRFGVDSFWDRYRSNPCDHTSVSIKAFSESSYQNTTGRSNFDQTKRGTSRAIEMSSSSNASVVYSGEDVEEIINLARFAKNCGARGLTISPSTPSYVKGKPETGSLFHPNNFVDGIATYYEELNDLFSSTISISVKLPLCIWPRELINLMIERNQIYSTCQLQHRTGLLFDTHGNMLSCNSLPDHHIGRWGQDFSDTSGLEAHLSNARVIKFYDRMTTYASKKCQNCSMNAKCGGGCPLFYGVYSGDDLIKGWDQ